MINLLIDKTIFLQDLNKPEVAKALELELNSIKMYEYYYSIFKNNIILQILNSKKMLEQIFTNESTFFAIDASYDEALILLLAEELKLVQAYKNASLVCENEEFKDLIFRLWASSVNEYQVALKQSLFANNQGIDSLVSNFLKDILK